MSAGSTITSAKKIPCPARVERASGESGRSAMTSDDGAGDREERRRRRGDGDRMREVGRDRHRKRIRAEELIRTVDDHLERRVDTVAGGEATEIGKRDRIDEQHHVTARGEIALERF